MAEEATRFKCPACGDRHDEAERKPDGHGGRRCPDCGHPVAEPLDVEVESPR